MYIDSHHAGFASRAYHISTYFADFQSFNMWELSKHHKRAACIMPSTTLAALAQNFFQLLQASYFLREGRRVIRGECEELAQSLLKYAQSIQNKNKSMKLVHSSLTPWRSIGKGLDLFYLHGTYEETFPWTKGDQCQGCRSRPLFRGVTSYEEEEAVASSLLAKN